MKINRQLSAAELQARIEALTAQLTALQKYRRGYTTFPFIIWRPIKYVVSLEQNIAFMKSPDYVPGKPLPNTIVPADGATDVASQNGVCARKAT